MNSNNSQSQNSQISNPNSQAPNLNFPYQFSNPYFPFVQNASMENTQFLNMQNRNFNSQVPSFPFSNNSFPYAQNSQMYPFPHVQNFTTSHPQFGNDQTPINVQDSQHSQFSGFNSREVIDLNDNSVEVEDIRESGVQWKWEEDKLLISAWLNVSIDPLIGTD